MVDHEKLSHVIIEFSRRRVGEYGVTEILDLLCTRVAEVLPVDGAGVMLEDDDGDLRFVAASDAKLDAIEALQIELGEGPCLRAYETGEQVIVTDMAMAKVFPEFGPRALEAGLKAVHSFPMRFENDRIGALNLYRERPGPFSSHDQFAGQVLADVATTMILNAQATEQSSKLVQQLQRALESRVIIEQAKGTLAERWGVDVTEAFDRLRRYSRVRGLKLREVAAQVVAGGLEIE